MIHRIVLLLALMWGASNVSAGTIENVHSYQPIPRHSLWIGMISEGALINANYELRLLPRFSIAVCGGSQVLFGNTRSASFGYFHPVKENVYLETRLGYALATDGGLFDDDTDLDKYDAFTMALQLRRYNGTRSGFFRFGLSAQSSDEISWVMPSFGFGFAF